MECHQPEKIHAVKSSDSMLYFQEYNTVPVIFMAIYKAFNQN